MGASQERAAFFNATLLVVTRHPVGPPGRPKIHPVLPRFALFFIKTMHLHLWLMAAVMTMIIAQANATILGVKKRKDKQTKPPKTRPSTTSLLLVPIEVPPKMSLMVYEPKTCSTSASIAQNREYGGFVTSLYERQLVNLIHLHLYIFRHTDD